MKKGYITVLFSVATALSMSLLITMFYSVRSSATRMKAVLATDTAMTSCFAEYSKALWERFDLLFVDAGYMTEVSGLALSEEHLRNCINKNFDECELGLLGGKDLLKLKCTEAEATAVCLASDDKGAAIKLQAVNLMKYHYKLAYVKETEELFDRIESYGLSGGISYDAAYEAAGELEKYKIDYSGWLPSVTGGNDISEDTPAPLSILNFVTDGGYSLTKVNGDLYAAKRKLNRGNLEKENKGNITDIFFLREYMMRYLGNYQNTRDDGLLSYQVEYLCSGKDSDCDNLASVARRILVIREAANLNTFMGDETRRSAVEAFCAGVCALFSAPPEVAKILETLIIAWWVNYESLTDVRIIMAGGKIPLIKTPAEWITGLGSLLGGNMDPKEHKEGLGYTDYLRVFLYTTGEKKIMKRFMSIAEMDVRKIPGNEWFRVDNCFDEWQVNITMISDHGYTYNAARRRRMIN